MWCGCSEHVFEDVSYGPNHGHPTTPIAKTVRPSQRKGITSTKTKFVRSIIREVAGFSAYERRVMELLRNSKVRCARTGDMIDTDIYITRIKGQES
jgi:large subunit ribosomal protein L36e